VHFGQQLPDSKPVMSTGTVTMQDPISRSEFKSSLMNSHM